LTGVVDLPGLLESRAKAEGAPHFEGTTAGFLGAVVIRPTQYSQLGRSTLDPRKLRVSEDLDQLGMLAEFRMHVLGHRLTVMAFPHQSQDTEVHSCAETALWSLFRYMSQRYKHYPERYPHDITKLNDDLQFGRTIPSKGLSLHQVASMIGKFGLEAVPYLRKELPQLDGDAEKVPRFSLFGCDQGLDLLELLTIYVDSGMPPVVTVPHHAFVAFGLQYSDEPLVERQGCILSASDFVSGIVVNDDNRPPYSVVPRSSEHAPYDWSEIKALAVPVPSRLFLVADDIDRIAGALFRKMEPFMGLEPGGVYVRRIVCTSSKNYKRSLRKNGGTLRGSRIVERILRQPLPHFLWIVELIHIDDWPGRKVTAEIVLDSTAGPFDRHPHLWMRIRGAMIVNWNRLYGSEIAEPVELDAPDSTFQAFRDNLKKL
ncbi:MAG: hypothetical protein MI919_17245, partial [Holophagales bacterium]|nr:hypothetical protein [Holophagales bacterium]